MTLRATLMLAALLAAPVAVQAAPVMAADVPSPVTLHFEADEVMGEFRLSAPRPNPFTAQTRLELTVDAPTDLTVAVYDALGRRVALIHEGAVRTGTYSLRVQASDLPAGLYLIRASDGRGQTATRSVALVR